jgi:hypothetical protein
MHRGTHSPRLTVSPDKQRSPGALRRRDGPVLPSSVPCREPSGELRPAWPWGVPGLSRVSPSPSPEPEAPEDAGGQNCLASLNPRRIKHQAGQHSRRTKPEDKSV